MPRSLASGYGLSQSLSFLDERIAGSGNEIVHCVYMINDEIQCLLTLLPVTGDKLIEPWQVSCMRI